uniref:F-box/LRR-repeat protein 15/At3g58940/PEG3-like LRR domain-containing protein n=1 Tax=Leersia perrieri TaxID=77586 RepID=A0A0D9WXQ9_9ORYZ
MAQFDLVASFDTMLLYQALDVVMELCLQYGLNGMTPHPLPFSVLTFLILHVTSFGFCTLRNHEQLEGIILANLEELMLMVISNSEDTFHAMVMACPKLKSLLLIDNDAFRRVCVKSQSLVYHVQFEAKPSTLKILAFWVDEAGLGVAVYILS